MGADRRRDRPETVVLLHNHLRKHSLLSIRVSRPAANPNLTQRLPRLRAGASPSPPARPPAAGHHVRRLVGRGQRTEPHPGHGCHCRRLRCLPGPGFR